MMRKIFFTFVLLLCSTSLTNFTYGQAPKLIFGSENELLSAKDNGFSAIACINDSYILTYQKDGKIPTLLEIDGNCNRIKENKLEEFDQETINFSLMIVIVDAFMRCNILEEPKKDVTI